MKTILLPAVLYGYESWSLPIREEHRLRMFENGVPRIKFGPKRDEIMGGLGKLHNEQLHNPYYSSNIIRMTNSRKMRLAENVA
jgi:hypothetical protein